MHARTKLIPIALLVAALCLPAAAADLTIVSNVTSNRGEAATATQYFADGKIRTSDGRYDTIMDLESGTMVHIDHKKETYFETSYDEVREQLAEVEKMLAENPMMAQMLGSATEVKVEKGSGTRTVAGYTCHQYLMSIGAGFEFELWVAPDLKPPTRYYDARKMVYAAMGPMATRFDQMFEEMKKIDGMPLVTKMDTKTMGINLNSVTEATEVRKGPIPAGTFDPPAGYKKKKSPYQDKKK